jgi:UDP-N-acetylmuramyl tripeptide synthase
MIAINDQKYPIDIHLLGEFNLSNILAVLATLIV